MKKLFVVFPAALIATAVMYGCATTHPVTSTDPKNPTTDTVARNTDVAAENDASYFTELSFKKGSSKLNDKKYEALKDLVQKSMKTGKVAEIKVISWSDKPYPQHQMKLSSKQQAIADHRNEKIKKYLQDMYPAVEVTTYNMAARPELFTDFLNTADIHTKHSFERAGVVSEGQKQAYYDEKKSKSLVMTILK